MALTSCSTSVAFSSRLSSRAPADAIFTITPANSAATSARDAEVILLGISDSSNANSLPQDGAVGLSQLPRLVFVRRMQLRGVGIAVMRVEVFGEALGCLHGFRMLRTQHRRQFSLRFEQQGLTLRCLVFCDQD